LQPLRWRCVECVIHHERDVREEQQYIYVARTSNNRVSMPCELYCFLLSQCKALRTCRSSFSNRNTSNSFPACICLLQEQFLAVETRFWRQTNISN